MINAKRKSNEELGAAFARNQSRTQWCPVRAGVAQQLKGAGIPPIDIRVRKCIIKPFKLEPVRIMVSPIC